MRAPESVAGARQWLTAIVGLAILVRVGAALYLGNVVAIQPGTADQLSYHALATRLLSGHGFSFDTGWWPATQPNEPTAHWSYLYVLYLAAVYGVVGPLPLAARILQAVLVGILQPLLTFRIASRLFGARVGLVSAALVAGYAYFIYYAGALMTESFFFVALLASVDAAMCLGDRERGAATRLGWVVLGIALATAVLLRQAVLLCTPVLLLWVAWRRRRGDRSAAGLRAVAGGLAITITVMAIAIVPWTIRNYRAFGGFVLLNTNAGFAFFWGNHPIHGHTFIPILPGAGSLYGDLIPEAVRGLNEADMDRELMRRGIAYVVDDPRRYVSLSVSRIREFLKFWPSSESDRVSNLARVASFGICLPFLVAGILQTCRRPALRRDAAGLILLCSVAAAYSGMHILVWTLVRYRLPVDALLLPFAAVSLVALSDRLFQRGPAVHQDALVVSN